MSYIETHAAELRPKLAILHEIAMLNVKESAARHAVDYNRNSWEPLFHKGSKVLLYDPTVKKGQSTKLQVKDHSSLRTLNLVITTVYRK